MAYIGQQIGNYRLIHLLGSGGFSEVYLGQHVHMSNRQVAVKIFTQLGHNFYQTFLQEAETIERLKHPHIIRILDCGIDNGITPYIIMEYASNGTLRNWYPRDTIVPLSNVDSYISQLAEALQYAHNRKTIHRDLKPENFLVGEKGEILLSDFGIAVIAHDTVSLITGNFAGTVAYSAPEQLAGRPRVESDQYSLGLIVYEWLSGERAFTGYMQQIAADPVPLRMKAPSISVEVESVVMKSLARDPKERFKSVKAFAKAFHDACYAQAAATTVADTSPEADSVDQQGTSFFRRFFDKLIGFPDPEEKLMVYVLVRWDDPMGEYADAVLEELNHPQNLLERAMGIDVVAIAIAF